MDSDSEILPTDQGGPEVELTTKDDSKRPLLSKRNVIGGLVVGGLGLGLTYAIREQLKNFTRWEQSIEQESQNSADMLTGKLNLAQHLIEAKDLKGGRASLLVAKAEARKILKLNREFEKRLAAFSAMPDGPDVT